MALTAKQTLFVQEYLADLNATQAAIRAGYSEKTAAQIAHQLMQKPEIAAAIAEAQEERVERIHVSQDDVVRELAAVAFADIKDYVAWGGRTVMLKNSPDLESAQAVQAVSSTSESVSIRMHDKLRALELLGRHVGLFREGGLPEGEVKVTVVWPEQAEM